MLATANVQALLETRARISEQIDFVDQSLQELRLSLSIAGVSSIVGERASSPEKQSEKPKKEKPTFKKLERTSTSVDKSLLKVKSPVWEILKKAGMPLGEDEIAIQLLQNGFDTDLPPEELIDVIYNQAINPLIQDGKIEFVGNRPFRKYKLS